MHVICQQNLPDDVKYVTWWTFDSSRDVVGTTDFTSAFLYPCAQAVRLSPLHYVCWCFPTFFATALFCFISCKQWISQSFNQHIVCSFAIILFSAVVKIVNDIFKYKVKLIIRACSIRLHFKIRQNRQKVMNSTINY